MRIPKNLIETGKYTSGKEFVYKITQTPFQGYYYILDNLYYVGKEYNKDAPELIKITSSNTLLNRKSTSIFSLVSGITSQALKTPKITSVQPNIENNKVDTRYFSRQVNIQPIIIKEIDKESYDSLQNNPLYQTTFIGNGQTIDQANTQMPGLKAFLIG